MVIRNAFVYTEEGHFEKKDLFIKEKFFTDEIDTQGNIIDAEGHYAIPGLTDIHFHGCVGYDFCDGTYEAIEAIAKYQAKHGVTTICPASMTLPEGVLSKILKVAATYESKEGAILCGVNLEGPFLSLGKKGAQNERYLTKPDYDLYKKLQETSCGLIKLVDVAPEEEGAMEFIQKVSKEVIVSIAHTMADYDCALEAFEHGANHVTHLYNAMQPLSHRAPGVIGAAMDTPGCNVELICDGIHVHPSVVRATLKMFGEERIILVSDSMMAAGMPNGRYTLGGQEVEVNDRKATLVTDGAIAGSATNLMECLKNVVNMGIPLQTAVKCAAVNPAKAIGIFNRYGSIRAGKIANVVLLDGGLNVRKVILNGKVFFESIS
ncbi:MAG TPA: N-acetylglucosamine-6-phosphate deacetylase [Lachnospiraceae bacterium]|nr:N-acetylglucosamine-6-phosphate deacetylase [Lachnospiraceae bacterium]